jgi:SAM-dependent methyltransferase
MGEPGSYKKHEVGFFQITPMPSSDELQSYYLDKYYQDNSALYKKYYSENELSELNFDFQLKYHELKKFINPNQKQFLDLGCGEGFYLNFFQKEGWDIEGWDFSSYGISKQNPSYLEFFKQGDIQKLCDDANGNYYSAVINASHILEHVLDPVGLLGKISKLLKKESILVLTVPNDFTELQLGLFKDGFVKNEYWVCPPDHVNYFNIINISEILNICNYEILSSFTTFPIDWFLFNTQSNYVENKS